MRENRSSSGYSLAAILTIVFVVLKLAKLIDWSWLWVLSPLWISLSLVILFVIGGVIYFKVKYPGSDIHWKFWI